MASAKVMVGSSGLTEAVPTFQVAPDNVSTMLLDGRLTLQTYSPALAPSAEILRDRLLLVKMNSLPGATAVDDPSLNQLTAQLLEAA